MSCYFPSFLCAISFVFEVPIDNVAFHPIMHPQTHFFTSVYNVNVAIRLANSVGCYCLLFENGSIEMHVPSYKRWFSNKNLFCCQTLVTQSVEQIHVPTSAVVLTDLISRTKSSQWSLGPGKVAPPNGLADYTVDL